VVVFILTVNIDLSLLNMAPNAWMVNNVFHWCSAWLCCVQLIADVKLLYGVDVSRLTDRLLLIHDSVLAETKNRATFDHYMSQFHRESETLDEGALSS